MDGHDVPLLVHQGLLPSPADMPQGVGLAGEHLGVRFWPVRLRRCLLTMADSSRLRQVTSQNAIFVDVTPALVVSQWVPLPAHMGRCDMPDASPVAAQMTMDVLGHMPCVVQQTGTL